MVGLSFVVFFFFFFLNRFLRELLLRPGLGSVTTLKISVICLFINPDNYSAFAKRRRAILEFEDFDVGFERTLMHLILKKHPKSEQVFLHLEFLVRTFPKDTDWEADVEICQLCEARYSRNYYAWKYRLFVAKANAEDLAFLRSELRRTATCQHVDASVLSYRRFLLKCLKEEPDFDSLKESELALLEEKGVALGKSTLNLHLEFFAH